MHKLAQSALSYVEKYDLLRPGERVGIAVSAGADSVALLRLMLELRNEIGLVISVVHLNHKLRGDESDADEHFVRELAQAQRLEIIIESRAAKPYAEEKKLGLEAAARQLRYDFFRGVLLANVDRVATAHTMDDQAETVLLKLMRGAGTRGIAGIYPRVVISNQSLAIGKTGRDEKRISKPDVPSIVRPLLGTRRSQLREYLAEIGQTWREDSTNQDLRHTRNRIRHEVLPRLERQVNPAVIRVLTEAAEIARAEEDHWALEVERLLPEIWREAGTLNFNQLNAVPLAVRRRLARAAAESLGLALEFSHVEEILGLSHEGDHASLPGRWVVSRRKGQLEFQVFREVSSNYEYQLSIPGKLAVPEAGIEIETALVGGNSQLHPHDLENLIASALVAGALVVRNWRPGEQFWPAHTKAPKKIKELLQDRHLTGEEKQRWPVVASGDEIVWLRGFGVRRDLHAKGENGVSIREIKRAPVTKGC